MSRFQGSICWRWHCPWGWTAPFAPHTE